MKIKLMALAILFVFAMMPFAVAQTLQERNRMAIEQYKTAKANYMQMKEKYENAREDFMKVRLRWRQFKNANESPELMAKAKEFLTKAIDRGVAHIELVERWVDKINISDEEKSELKANLEESKAKLEGLKDDVEAATTKQEIEDIAKQIREAWMDIRKDVKRIVGIGLNMRIKHILNRMELLSGRLNDRIEKLKEQGADTSNLESLLAEFNSNLNLANENYEKAKEKFNEAKSAKEVDNIVREGNQFVREAHKYLKEAHATLVKIVKELRQSTKQLNKTESAAETTSETTNATETNTTEVQT